MKQYVISFSRGRSHLFPIEETITNGGERKRNDYSGNGSRPLNQCQGVDGPVMKYLIQRPKHKRMKDINPHRVTLPDSLYLALMSFWVFYRVDEHGEYLRECHDVHAKITAHQFSFNQAQQR